jgi:hypothetical protein
MWLVDGGLALVERSLILVLLCSDPSPKAETEIKKIINGPLSHLKYWKVDKVTFLDYPGKWRSLEMPQNQNEKERKESIIAGNDTFRHDF